MNNRWHGLRIRVLLMTMLVAWTAMAVVGWYSSRIATAALTRQILPVSAQDLAGIAHAVGREAGGTHDWHKVQGTLEAAAARTEKQFAVFDSSGRAVAASSRALLRMHLRLSGDAVLTWQDTARAVDSTGTETIVARMHRMIGAGAPMSTVRDPAGGVAGTLVALPSSIEFDGARPGLDGLRRSLVVGMLVAALGALVAGITLTAPIVRPVERLTAAARAITQRGLDGTQRARIHAGGSGEVAALGHAFDVMVAALDEQEEMRRAMTSDIAHELRTPLTNIRCQIESIQDGLVAPDAAALASVHDEVLVLQRLIGDLQDLTLAEQKRLRLSMGVQNAWEALDAVAQTFRRQAAIAEVEICVAPPEAPGFVCADRLRLRQVMSNLVSNALAHAPRGTAIELGARQRAGEIVFTVRDSGPGIPLDHQPHLFKRFYRLEESRSRARGGAGLGLAIVKEIVELHGGRVWLESTPGGGAAFSVALPRHQPVMAGDCSPSPS
jgi:signal transduction histidine kinase